MSLAWTYLYRRMTRMRQGRIGDWRNFFPAWKYGSRSCQLFARPKARKMGFASFPRLGGGYFTYRTLTNWRSCLRRIWSRLKGACNSYCRSVYQWVLRVAYGTSIWSRGCCMTLRRTSMERAPPRGTIASKLAAMVRSRVSSLALLNMTSGGFECFPKLRQSK
ncbi:hypothetical protein MLD38_025175 [Melastoma candidum]|uniref:Uncharacterized protein n=1 Tax=Melastoma candidum TaxID=119954 RepID=A0ACB9P1G1_9MYRT|nr:hypothetical protein MLD38_025175 [Melastoma candidum]